MTVSARSSTPARQSAGTGLKAFGLLIVAAALASAAIVPYARVLAGEEVSTLPVWGWLVAVLSNLTLLAPVTALGLWLGPKVGLGAPLLYAWIEGQPDASGHLVRRAGFAAGVGAVTGIVLVLGAAAFAPWLPVELSQAPVPAWWHGLLASFSAGITEELLLRLGLTTLLVWGMTRLARRDHPSTAIIWAAIAIAALIFGAAHLPLAASLAPLTTMMIVRTLVLNAVGGLVFGWLYWRSGLIPAMVAHTSTDIVLHVLPVLVMQGV